MGTGDLSSPHNGLQTYIAGTAEAEHMKATWPVIVHARLYIARRPRLKRIAAYVLTRYPGLSKRLRIGAVTVSFSPATPGHGAFNLAYPTRHAQQIHTELKLAIERQELERD